MSVGVKGVYIVLYVVFDVIERFGDKNIIIVWLENLFFDDLDFVCRFFVMIDMF